MQECCKTPGLVLRKIIMNIFWQYKMLKLERIEKKLKIQMPKAFKAKEIANN